MLAPKLVLAAVCLVQGLFPVPVLRAHRLGPAAARRDSCLATPSHPAAPGRERSRSPLFGLRLTDLFGAGLNAATSPLLVLGCS